MNSAQIKYQRTRDRVEDYFDRTATRTWERLTSDAPVSGIRATVRAGRDEMRDAILAELPNDLRGMRVLDAGCGTGALATELAKRGAAVVAIDISPSLIEIAHKRMPAFLAGSVDFKVGDLTDPDLGQFDFVCAMDSLIYYDSGEVASIVEDLGKRTSHAIVFTIPPRTVLLWLMWQFGKFFPRSDRSPTMVPQSEGQLARQFSSGRFGARHHVRSGFYFSSLYRFEVGERK